MNNANESVADLDENPLVLIVSLGLGSDCFNNACLLPGALQRDDTLYGIYNIYYQDSTASYDPKSESDTYIAELFNKLDSNNIDRNRNYRLFGVMKDEFSRLVSKVSNLTTLVRYNDPGFYDKFVTNDNKWSIINVDNTNALFPFNGQSILLATLNMIKDDLSDNTLSSALDFEGKLLAKLNFFKNIFKEEDRAHKFLFGVGADIFNATLCDYLRNIPINYSNINPEYPLIFYATVPNKLSILSDSNGIVSNSDVFNSDIVRCPAAAALDKYSTHPRFLEYLALQEDEKNTFFNYTLSGVNKIGTVLHYALEMPNFLSLTIDQKIQLIQSLATRGNVNVLSYTADTERRRVPSYLISILQLDEVANSVNTKAQLQTILTNTGYDQRVRNWTLDELIILLIKSSQSTQQIVNYLSGTIKSVKYKIYSTDSINPLYFIATMDNLFGEDIFRAACNIDGALDRLDTLQLIAMYYYTSDTTVLDKFFNISYMYDQLSRQVDIHDFFAKLQLFAQDPKKISLYPDLIRYYPVLLQSDATANNRSKVLSDILAIKNSLSESLTNRIYYTNSILVDQVATITDFYNKLLTKDYNTNARDFFITFQILARDPKKVALYPDTEKYASFLDYGVATTTNAAKVLNDILNIKNSLSQALTDQISFNQEISNRYVDLFLTILNEKGIDSTPYKSYKTYGILVDEIVRMGQKLSNSNIPVRYLDSGFNRRFISTNKWIPLDFSNEYYNPQNNEQMLALYALPTFDKQAAIVATLLELQSSYAAPLPAQNRLTNASELLKFWQAIFNDEDRVKLFEYKRGNLTIPSFNLFNLCRYLGKGSYSEANIVFYATVPDKFNFPSTNIIYSTVLDNSIATPQLVTLNESSANRYIFNNNGDGIARLPFDAALCNWNLHPAFLQYLTLTEEERDRVITYPDNMSKQGRIIHYAIETYLDSINNKSAFLQYLVTSENINSPINLNVNSLIPSPLALALNLNVSSESIQALINVGVDTRVTLQALKESGCTRDFGNYPLNISFLEYLVKSADLLTLVMFKKPLEDNVEYNTALANLVTSEGPLLHLAATYSSEVNDPKDSVRDEIVKHLLIVGANPVATCSSNDLRTYIDIALGLTTKDSISSASNPIAGQDRRGISTYFLSKSELFGNNYSNADSNGNTLSITGKTILEIAFDKAMNENDYTYLSTMNILTLSNRKDSITSNYINPYERRVDVPNFSGKQFISYVLSYSLSDKSRGNVVNTYRKIVLDVLPDVACLMPNDPAYKFPLPSLSANALCNFVFNYNANKRENMVERIKIIQDKISKIVMVANISIPIGVADFADLLNVQSLRTPLISGKNGTKGMVSQNRLPICHFIESFSDTVSNYRTQEDEDYLISVIRSLVFDPIYVSRNETDLTERLLRDGDNNPNSNRIVRRYSGCSRVTDDNKNLLMILIENGWVNAAKNLLENAYINSLVRFSNGATIYVDESILKDLLALDITTVPNKVFEKLNGEIVPNKNDYSDITYARNFLSILFSTISKPVYDLNNFDPYKETTYYNSLIAFVAELLTPTVLSTTVGDTQGTLGDAAVVNAIKKTIVTNLNIRQTLSNQDSVIAVNVNNNAYCHLIGGNIWSIPLRKRIFDQVSELQLKGVIGNNDFSIATKTITTIVQVTNGVIAQLERADNTSFKDFRGLNNVSLDMSGGSSSSCYSHLAAYHGMYELLNFDNLLYCTPVGNIPRVHNLGPMETNGKNILHLLIDYATNIAQDNSPSADYANNFGRWKQAIVDLKTLCESACPTSGNTQGIWDEITNQTIDLKYVQNIRTIYRKIDGNTIWEQYTDVFETTYSKKHNAITGSNNPEPIVDNVDILIRNSSRNYESSPLTPRQYYGMLFPNDEDNVLNLFL